MQGIYSLCTLQYILGNRPNWLWSFSISEEIYLLVMGHWPLALGFKACIIIDLCYYWVTLLKMWANSMLARVCPWCLQAVTHIYKVFWSHKQGFFLCLPMHAINHPFPRPKTILVVLVGVGGGGSWWTTVLLLGKVYLLVTTDRYLCMLQTPEVNVLMMHLLESFLHTTHLMLVGSTPEYSLSSGRGNTAEICLHDI